jgi:hypothetical protein
MQLISSRTVPFPATHPLPNGQAREALFRNDDGRFILYLTDGSQPAPSEERVIFLELREALLWLNEPAQEQRASWS